MSIQTPLLATHSHRPGAGPQRIERAPASTAVASSSPEAVTRAASTQTYWTIQLLVDRDRVHQAFQAYAYFRWFDDALDRPEAAPRERTELAARQADLIERAYRGEVLTGLQAEERWLVDLIAWDRCRPSGLAAYIKNLWAVMALDTRRRGRLISQTELDAYTEHLAVGVTEAMHFFIGHDRPEPALAWRYQAVTGAHITHMLRDTVDDLAAGYINVPREVLDAGGIAPHAIDSAPYRAWVEQRVTRARACFALGRRCLATLASWRCRLAGFAYLRRFERVLDQIERDCYQLRPAYSESLSPAGWASLSASALWLACRPNASQPAAY